MKYRIKITTYANGRKAFTAQFKTKLMWCSLWYDGEVSLIGGGDSVESRERALERIDKHYAGNVKKQSIEFEYIRPTH